MIVDYYLLLIYASNFTLILLEQKGETFNMVGLKKFFVYKNGFFFFYYGRI